MGKRRKRWVLAFSPIPTMFWKTFILMDHCKWGWCGKGFNPLLNNKISDASEFKAVADDKLHIAKMMISLLDQVENTVGKGENAFQCFSKPSASGSLKVRILYSLILTYTVKKIQFDLIL